MAPGRSDGNPYNVAQLDDTAGLGKLGNQPDYGGVVGRNPSKTL
jgi:hypothetical protein